jgi:hypothetical protein
VRLRAGLLGFAMSCLETPAFKNAALKNVSRLQEKPPGTSISERRALVLRGNTTLRVMMCQASWREAWDKRTLYDVFSQVESETLADCQDFR